jgi:hypothetical protein
MKCSAHARSVAVGVRAGDQVENSALRIGAVQDGGGSTDHLDLLHRAGVDGREVLARPVAVGAVVEWNPVYEQEDLVSR